MKLSTIIILTVLLALNFTVNGQQVEYYKFYSQVSFMPAGELKKEIYEKQKNHLFHFSETRSFKKSNKTVKTKLINDKAFDSEIIAFDSLLKLKTFTFIVEKSLIEEIKRDTFSKTYYKVQNLEIDKFFEKKNTLKISLNNIKEDTLDDYSIYDGRPFSFHFVYKLELEDTTELKYFGNLDDGVKTKDIKYWLPLYFLINKYKLFKTNNYVINFFDDKHFRSVLLRFIKWESH